MQHIDPQPTSTVEFKDRLLSVMGARAVTQARLARRLGVRPQWVYQLATGKRRPSAETVRRIAGALDVSVEALWPMTGVHAPTATDRLQHRLDQICGHLGAASCTLYVRDPLWRTEYRLATMSGITFQEPMFGFLSRKREAALGSERFVSHALTMKNGGRLAPIDWVPQANRHLFGSFCEREGIRAYARLAHPPQASTPEAILFVNYRTGREFNEAEKIAHRKQLRVLLTELPAVQRQLAERDKEWLADGARIVQPASSITAKDLVGQRLGMYFRRILESALEALGISGDTGLGTIHLYNADAQMLELAGSCGAITIPGNAESHSVARGAGIASWVVRHRRGLLIPDLAASSFQAIHISLNDAVRCELAVPLEIDGELLGVLDLQCTEAHRFKPHHVRSVWYAANRIAIVYRLYSQAEMNKELLEVCSNATTGGQDADVALSQVARLAVKYLRAKSCNIWIYDARNKRFTSGASSEGRLFDKVPPRRQTRRAGTCRVRPHGFSAHAMTWQCPLWLCNIRDATHFETFYWFSARWHAGMPSQRRPRTVNTVLQGQDVRCQLGIPIAFQGRCIGVAWVKFAQDREPPSGTLMTLTQGFMAAAGLILEAVRRR